MPLNWQTGVVVPLFINGNQRVCSSYWGPTLLSLHGKVYLEVLEKRVLQIVEAAGLKNSNFKSEATVLSRKKVARLFQVGEEILPQMEFNYFAVLFMSEGKMEREIDRWFGAASPVMRVLHRSVMMKRELSRKAKLSIYQSISVPTLTYSHELWVVIEKFVVSTNSQSVCVCKDTYIFMF